MLITFPCSEHVSCPGSDWPILNLSAEGPDAPIFIGWRDMFRTPNITGDNFTSPWCLGICESTISQAAADECAELAALECIVGTLVGNDEITITISCP